MKRALRHLLVLLPVALLVGSCVGTDTPTAVGEREVRFNIPINPALIPSPADGSAAPVNRIRARATRVSDDVVLGETVLDVSPTADEWEITLDVGFTGDETEVTVFIYLIHVEGDVETVEFSGMVGPLSLSAGQLLEPTDVPILRGPIENFFTTGVTITVAPATLVEGMAAVLEADATTSSDSIPVIFWTVLDSAILSTSDADVTALAPGTGRVVASAGTFADTASIVVTSAPAGVIVSPDTASVVGGGAQATFSAVVIDVRGDTLPAESVIWGTSTPLIIASLGNGLFEGLSAGDGIVEATASSDPTLVGTAVMVVGSAPADVSVTKSAAVATVQEADTVDFEIVVSNGSQDVLVGVAVSDSVPAGLTVESSAPQGVFDAGTGTWTWSLDTLAVGATETITVRASVDTGLGAVTLTNVALVSPPSGFADPDPSNNRAEASVSVTTDAPDLRVLVAANDSTPADGDTIQVTVDVENLDVTGAVDVTNVVVGAAGSDELTVVSTTLDQGTYDTQNDLWIVGDLAIGTTASATLDVEVASGSVGLTLFGAAFVASLDQTQSNLANDTATVTLTVGTRNVDVEVLKTVDEAQPLGDSTVVFTVSLVNNGRGEANDLMVFDTLDNYFLNPVHVVSVGTLLDDTLWTVASLAEGDTATWTTTAVVSSDAGGSSATNTAILRSLAQNDTTPANDTVVVAMTFPVSAVPVVQITAPADGSVYDPGDPVTFIGVATDAEEGDLTPMIQWVSDVDGAVATGRTFQTAVLTTGVHNISATATDQDGGVGADTIQVTIALITTPATLNVPFGGSASLPITLSEPAPPGGFTLSVTTSDAAITGPASPTVFIAEGALSANATLSGTLPGTADITVSHPQFGASVTSASVTAELDILGGNVSFATPFTETVTVQFESQGTPIAAPPGGLPVTMSSGDNTCVSVPSSITIPPGQINTVTTLSYGGSATPTCQTYVYAMSTGVVTDSVLVSVTAAPAITVNSTTVGAGLQRTVSASLGVANHGGTTVTLTSADGQILLLSPNSTTAGAPSLDIVVPDGTSGFTYYVQGFEGATGTPTVTATATNFSNGTGTITVVQSGLIIQGLSTTTTTQTPDDELYASVGIPSGNSVSVQNIRAGGTPIQVTFNTDDTQVGLLTDGVTPGASVTATIPLGLYYTPTSVATGGVAHDPVGAGTATITATAPGIISQPNATQTVTVTTPNITMNNTTVGSGLHRSASGSLGATGHGGTTVTLTSSNAQVLLLSPNASTPGTASIDIAMADGTSSFTYYVQGFEGATGTPTVTATATNFNNGTGTITVVQPGLILQGLSSTATTLTPDDEFYASVGIPSGNSVSVQNIRPGGTPIQVTFSTDDTQVGLLTDGATPGASVTATIPLGLYYTPTSVATGGVAHDPVGGGTATITAAATGIISQPNATQTVTVTTPNITMNNTTVGSGLHRSTSGSLGATGHGGTTVTLTSSNAQVLLVSPNASTPGTASIDIAMADGTSGFTYYVQGFEGATGTPTVTATATNFNNGTGTITVVQPGLILQGLSSTATTLTPDDEFYASVGIPSGNSVSVQNIRPGGTPIQVTFDTDDTGVGWLTDGVNLSASLTVAIPVGLYYTPTSVATGGVAHDPVGGGTATITAAATGIISQPNATQTVTVSAPGIALNNTTVGSGLQQSASGSLGATGHGGVTVTLTSLDPQTMLLAPNAGTAGTASIDIVIADGTSGFTYYVQGFEGATGTPLVTATAAGFLNGSATITVVRPGLIIQGLSTTTTAAAADDEFYASVGIPSGNSVSVQNIRTGGTPITVTVTSSNVASGELVTADDRGASVTATIQVGSYFTPTAVASGGFALDPLAEGATTIQATAAEATTQPTGTVTVTINP